MMSSKRSRRSKVLSQNPLFLRNEYNGECDYDIPMLAKSVICDESLELISFKSIKDNDVMNCNKAVHFFIDDADMERVYNFPDRYVKRLAQYKCLLTPDFSLLDTMPLWKQIGNVARSRWCGRYWQSLGIPIIPTVSWSTEQSYNFAFLGLEQGTAVAVSTVGVFSCVESKNLFMSGYREMIRRVSPEIVYCYGVPLPEICAEVISLDYLKTTRRAS